MILKRNLIYFIPILFISCKQPGFIYPQQKDIVETVYASGKIIAEKEYNVYALNGGTIIKKLVKDGDTVVKGQMLYIIKTDVPAAKLDAAQTTYNNAQNNLSSQSRIINDLKLSMKNAALNFTNDSLQYHRLKNLFDQDVGTKSNLDNAYTNYQVSANQKKSATEKYYATLNDLKVNLSTAKSQLVNATNDMSNNFIRSESNGTVYQTLKETGEAVKINEPVAFIGPSKQRVIRLAVDQQDIDQIKTGQLVLLKTDVTGNKVYRATISQIYPLMNETDQTFRVDAVFEGGSDQPYIHSSVEANIIIKTSKRAMVIPRVALLAGDSVLIKRNDKTQTVAVKTGILSLDDAEIIAGLKVDDKVLIKSQ